MHRDFDVDAAGTVMGQPKLVDEFNDPAMRLGFLGCLQRGRRLRCRGGEVLHMKKVSTALDQLLECPDDQRIAVEGGLQRVASVVVLQELFSIG